MTDPLVFRAEGAEELEALRVALLSAYYSAADEERALTRLLREGKFFGDTERRRYEDGRAQAALRAHRYSLLADRVLAALPTIRRLDTPNTPNTLDTPGKPEGGDTPGDTPVDD